MKNTKTLMTLLLASAGFTTTLSSPADARRLSISYVALERACDRHGGVFFNENGGYGCVTAGGQIFCDAATTQCEGSRARTFAPLNDSSALPPPRTSGSALPPARN